MKPSDNTHPFSGWDCLWKKGGVTVDEKEENYGLERRHECMQPF